MTGDVVRPRMQPVRVLLGALAGLILTIATARFTTAYLQGIPGGYGGLAFLLLPAAAAAGLCFPQVRNAREGFVLGLCLGALAALLLALAVLLLVTYAVRGEP